MLLGAQINVKTDHRNLTHELGAFSTQRVLRWHLYLEEFNPTFEYIKGENSVTSDALSRLPRSPSLEGENVGPTATSHGAFAIEIDDKELLHCFLLHPQFNNVDAYPLDYGVIRQHQQQDQELVQAVRRFAARYPILNFHGINLICYLAESNKPWKIVIPTAMLEPFIQWYHKVLAHVGMTKLEDTIRVHFHHPKLKEKINRIIGKCDPCQRYKVQGPGYGELPPRETGIAPWDKVAVDCIGPWKVKVNGQMIKFNALTCVDPVSCFPDAFRLTNRTSTHTNVI
jgi:hypothetical protein